MHVSSFFSSLPGMYISQSFLHMLVSALLVDRAISSWRIENPLITQRFRFVTILFPVFSFPLYQLVFPERGSVAFRQAALFDSQKWAYMELWGKVPLGIFFILILSATTVIFLLQEAVPVVRHTLESRKAESGNEEGEDPSPYNGPVGFGPGTPDIFVLADDEFAVFSTTGRNGAIYLSSGLMKALDTEEIAAVVAHEFAHVKRGRRPLLVFIFVLRALMFFNPIVLLEFRRAVQEEEQICDDMAVCLTGKPKVLADTLRKLYHTAGDDPGLRVGKPSEMRSSLEEFSHHRHIGSRIRRLERESAPQGGEWVKYSLTFITIAVINFFVV